MTALTHVDDRISPYDAFVARCEARAILFGYGEMTLHEAVDGLQSAAEAQGLVVSLGVDALQVIMAKAFEPWRDRA